MAQIDITRGYANQEALLEADLDSIRNDVITFVDITRLDDDNFQANSITGSSKLVDSSVTTAVIADQAITGNKINNNAVTTAKFANGAVTTAKIINQGVTTAKIAAGTIGQGKFALLSVPADKRADPGEQLSSAVDFTTNSGSEVNVTNLTVTITTTGKSVMLYLQKTSTTAHAGLQGTSNNATPSTFEIYRDSTVIAVFIMGMNATSGSAHTFQMPPSAITYIDSPAAGTYTYKITAISPSSPTTTTGVRNCKLVAYEIV